MCNIHPNDYTNQFRPHRYEVQILGWLETNPLFGIVSLLVSVIILVSVLFAFGYCLIFLITLIFSFMAALMSVAGIYLFLLEKIFSYFRHFGQ